MMIKKGYFIITDITGYTIFLTESELDHAHHIIQGLFESQLEVIGTPLQISNFQGDAILCHVPEETVGQGADLMDQVDAIYDAFSAKIAEMQIDPPCGCNACSNITMLDLKMFMHYGEYLVKTVGTSDEIIGSDVITAHRMMKNDVPEKTGIHSYLLVTETALKNLGIENDTKFVNYTQSYEHIGEVAMGVTQLGTAAGNPFQPQK
ncbi:MAG: DUF2652 domain-containing protein [FCB group bacterium]|nr:DUF2652 domain-containing protein [FCB group bacterium]MBL7028390.1 DUF2652 domain-containing protein [Candidatus Neomarinimicrobiota bacterium]MBL7121265.1 DUF2652 domain-containing protein [Candidatus Neomarinimicrobiota bacterium]